ncbi:S9 family peptidase [Acrocarpospora macrocephala]|uniref:Acyl-peptide hydrolase n=1 Tax=Acrocarpospora macrocephala TaxID=150177 RepID=A0A5M3WMI5_9ACTN|nr:S9 family peptidase [Acrocarpospora macrocephala]GES10497.1 acyl-peptide hydrolase [Acrocarpospora macrocephala]
MRGDLRDTAEFAAVAEHVRRLHEPAFGRPHDLAEPHVTADGARVVVTGSVFDELIGRPRTGLYTVEGGALSAVTTAAGSARWGRFSPDGARLAFLSDRARPGVFQLYLLGAGSPGEAAPAPSVPGSVEYAHWSPDGRRILLGVAGLGADLAATQGAVANTTVDAGLPDWHPLIEDGATESAWRTLWLYSLDDGDLTQVSAGGMNCWEAAWCGLSTVVTVASDTPDEDAWYTSRLMSIDTGTGTTRELLRGRFQLGLPAGSPDGRYVAVVQAVCSDRWIVAGDLTLIDPASGTTSGIDTAGTDVSCLQWIDTDRLGYLGQRHLDSVAGVVDVRTGEVTELFSTSNSCGGLYPDGAFTRDGRVVVAESAYGLPPQVAVLGPGAAGVAASTRHAGCDYLLSVAGSAEAITWLAPDGQVIEGLLCRPAGKGPFPLVVNIHGGPVWAFRDAWSMKSPLVPLLVSRGYAVLNPNPRGSGGRGRDFAAHVVGDMGGGDALDILAGVDTLVGKGLADPARIGLIGTSYGGFMTAWLVTQDQRFAAAVPIAPITDWYSQSFTSNIAGWGNAFLRCDPQEPGTMAHTRSPVLRAGNVRTPCLSVAGAGDHCTPPGQAREFHQALLAHGVESVLAIYPQEGHGVRSYPAITDLLTRVLSWFSTHMPPTA